jgi:hypothetical protein
VFNRIYRLEIQPVLLVFSTHGFVNYCFYNLLSGSPPPPLPPSHCQRTVLQTVCGWEVVGVLSCVGDHILQEFNTLFLTRFRATKLLDHPKQKPRRGGGLIQIITCRKVPLHISFLDDDIWHCLLSV